MNEQRREAEDAQEYLENKDDETRWDFSKARKVRSRRGEGPSTVFTLRLAPEELTRFAAFAVSHDMSIAELFRKGAEELMSRMLAQQEGDPVDRYYSNLNQVMEGLHNMQDAFARTTMKESARTHAGTQ